MPQETFEEFVDKVRLAVTEGFNKKGEIPPTWFVQRSDDQIIQVVTSFQGDSEKDIVDFGMRLLIKSEGVQRYAYISEVWFACPAKDEVQGENYVGTRPSQRPDRQEAVMLHAEDISGKVVSGYSIIRRNGEVAMITELKVDELLKVQVKGRFVNMFKERKYQG